MRTTTPKTYKIPDPPKGMFTAEEWSKILKGREERAKNGTQAVGD
jgi:hypothetical protein